MASIHDEIDLAVDAARAWSALRQVGLAHRLFAGVLVDGRLDGDVRTVTFGNGLVTRERIVDVTEDRRRVVYSVIEGTPMIHHNASMQISTAEKVDPDLCGSRIFCPTISARPCCR